MQTVDRIMTIVDALVSAIGNLTIMEQSGSDSEYEAADIAVAQARDDVKNALITALIPQGDTNGTN